MNILQVKKYYQNIDRNDLKYETNKDVHNFQIFQTIRSYGNSIFNCKITLKFNSKVRQRSNTENINF